MEIRLLCVFHAVCAGMRRLSVGKDYDYTYHLSAVVPLATCHLA